MSIRRQEALDYHAQGRPGKIQVSPTKPFKNQRDLSLAYTPGVEPCREIAARPEEAYAYTAKGLFKAFADIDVFDLAAPRARARAAGGRRDAGRYRRGRADLDPDLS